MIQDNRILALTNTELKILLLLRESIEKLIEANNHLVKANGYGLNIDEIERSQLDINFSDSRIFCKVKDSQELGDVKGAAADMFGSDEDKVKAFMDIVGKKTDCEIIQNVYGDIEFKIRINKETLYLHPHYIKQVYKKDGYRIVNMRTLSPFEFRN